MNENFLITIDGSMEADGEADSISLTTVGAFYKKGEKYYICYKETRATGYEGCTTTLKVWDGGVALMRFGKQGNTNLIIEKGAVNLCAYQTPAGPVMLDINGIDINNNLSENGGDLSFSYSLNAGGMLISDNKVNVKVKEIQQSEFGKV